MVVADVLALVERFAAVALADPLSALLLAIGGVLTGLTVAVGGWLAAGAAIDAITPPRPGRSHPERG